MSEWEGGGRGHRWETREHCNERVVPVTLIGRREGGGEGGEGEGGDRCIRRYREREGLSIPKKWTKSPF